MNTHRALLPMLVVSTVCSWAAAQPVSYNLSGQIGSLYDRLGAGGVGRMGYVGDSIAFQPPQHAHLRDRFGSDYGLAGYGYRGINADFKWLPDVKISYQGQDSNIVKSPSRGLRDPTWGIYTADGIYTRLRADGAAVLTVPSGSTCRLHYLTFPGGGTLGVDRAGVRIMSINTSKPAADVMVMLPPGTQYRLYSVSGGWVQVNGLEITDPSGFCLDRLRGNNGPHDYDTANTPSTARFYGELHDDVVWIEMDWVGPGEKESTYVADMTAYIKFLRSSVPGVGIILCSHHAEKGTTNEQSLILYQMAKDLNVGFVDHWALMTHDELMAAGYLTLDEVHLTDAGGAFFAAHDYQMLQAAR